MIPTLNLASSNRVLAVSYATSSCWLQLTSLIEVESVSLQGKSTRAVTRAYSFKYPEHRGPSSQKFYTFLFCTKRTKQSAWLFQFLCIRFLSFPVLQSGTYTPHFHEHLQRSQECVMKISVHQQPLYETRHSLHMSQFQVLLTHPSILV